MLLSKQAEVIAGTGITKPGDHVLAAHCRAGEVDFRINDIENKRADAIAVTAVTGVVRNPFNGIGSKRQN